MKIAEVSERCGLSPDTLRYYEKVGLLQPVQRAANGRRDYSELDVQRVEFIKCMRRAGLPIEVLIAYIALGQQGDDTMPARKAILQEQRTLLAGRVAELQQTLAVLDGKIAFYENALSGREKALRE